MIYKIKNKKKALSLTGGTSLKDKIFGYTFSQLYEVLGEPTFNQPSGDEKMQFEWYLLIKEILSQSMIGKLTINNIL